jgi:hypothetical protein
MKTRVVVAAVLWVVGAGYGGTDSTSEPSEPKPVVYFLGAGGGFESGIGLHLGVVLFDANTIQAGGGALYDNDDGILWYSAGLRYLRDIVQGKAVNSYAWAGASIYGRKGGYEEPDESSMAPDTANRVEVQNYIISPGLGIGLAFHFGLPFHFYVDTGFRFFHESDNPHDGTQIKPTINGSVTYHW